jgi:hypothetical protein
MPESAITIIKNGSLERILVTCWVDEKKNFLCLDYPPFRHVKRHLYQLLFSSKGTGYCGDIVGCKLMWGLLPETASKHIELEINAVSSG